MLLLTFFAAGERYAIDVARVVEVVPRVAPREVPRAPEHLAGYLGYRGEVVPVIDLGVLLGGGASPGLLDTRIILVRTAAPGHNPDEEGAGKAVQGAVSTSSVSIAERGTLLGLIAGRVGDLVRVPNEQVVAAPVRLEQAPYLDSIALIEDGHVPLISVPKLAAALLFAGAG